MRIVLDSSALIAAAISRAGVCAELLEDVLTHHELVISDFITHELRRKLRDKFNFPESEVRQLQRFLGKVATAVVPADLSMDVCRDPADIPVLGTAVAGNASILVTVDKNLLTIREFQGIAIIKPGEFWRQTTG
ncbi:MAG TPA: putative toxin-antitoxin system toxin component, PIN family [Steroidobacteraceae bacterium]|nr:putative toxin-antitoxin system toxin component, PIN family [Steroidobacteraceae bacterium]